MYTEAPIAIRFLLAALLRELIVAHVAELTQCRIYFEVTVVERIRAADVVVFGTPVYFGDQSESMRAFTDRLRRICRAQEHRQGIAGKPAVGICVAGGGGGGAPSCTVSLEKVLRTCGFDIVDMVPARRQNLDLKLEILETTGRWLATGPTS